MYLVRNQMILPIYHTYQPPDVRSHFFHAGTMVQKRWKGLGRIWSVEHHIQLAHCVNCDQRKTTAKFFNFFRFVANKTQYTHTQKRKKILHCCVLLTFYCLKIWNIVIRQNYSAKDQYRFLKKQDQMYLQISNRKYTHLPNLIRKIFKL